MANTVNFLSYANTFGDQMVTINNLALENNNLALSNYIKPSGTLYLNSPYLGLQVANNAVIAGQLQVQGVGSSAYIQNNLRVDTQVYFTNTTLGLVNSGQANIGGPLLAMGSGNGLQVSNNATIGGNVIVYQSGTIVGNANIGGTLLTTGAVTLQNTLSVLQDASFSGNINAGKYITVTNDVNATDFVASQSFIGSSLNIFNNAAIGGQLSVSGNFVLNGTTVYNTNTFTINANSSVGAISSFNVNRGALPLATIRWNEANTYWDIRDVNNSTSYSKILTANLISDSITTVNSNGLASQTAVNTVYTYLQANVASLQSQLTSNSGTLTSFSQAAFNRANTGTGTFNGTTGQAISNNGVITYASNNGVVISGVANTLYISNAQDLRTTASPSFSGLTLSGFPTAPTAVNGTSNTQIATTGFVLNELSSGGTFGINISGNASTTTQTNFTNLTINSSQVVTAANYNTYTPTLTGTGASGNWGINITGTAAVASSVAWTGVSGRPTLVSQFVNDSGYLTSAGAIQNATYAATYAIAYSNHTNANYQLLWGSGTNAYGTDYLFVNPSSGALYSYNNITAYYSSDRKFKENIQPIENALDTVDAIGGKLFDWTDEYIADHGGPDDYFMQKQDFGVIAQDVLASFPRAVRTKKDGTLAVDYEKLAALAFAAISELRKEVEELKKK